jgi:hypothetical protein
VGIAAFGDQDIDHLMVLIDGAVEVGPAAGDLDIGLVHLPTIPSRLAGRACGVDELLCERLDPPVDSHMVDLDAAFSEQFFHVAVGQAIAQVPAHRDRDHLAREPISGRSGRA